MKQLSNVKFIYNQHGCEQGIPWPTIADSENNKCCVDDGWQILGWCKNPPIDEFKKGFGLMFECQKSTCEAEAGTIVWYHYTADELSEFNINVKEGEKKMIKRQITLPTEDLDLFLLLMNKNRNNLCEENMEELDLNGGVKTDAIGKRKSLVKEIDRIYSHILMTFKVIEISQREITLPMDDLNLILDTVNEKRESLCRENIKEMVSNGGVHSISTRDRDELVDDIDRICKHILMTYV